ncbi:MAG: hypothetical protein QGG67_01540 [Gammaproteobacteria bacterium]|nr:hypothetical protein [Gammaproteobacteria bacterium]MDP7455628.1 hypothetical protein [Gammaproteobacteria bacterium]
MKFRFRMDRKMLIRLGCLLLLLAVLPFSMELILLIDIGGIDFALTFLIFYLGATYNTLIVKLDNLKRDVSDFGFFISGLYMFKPRVFVPHATASGVLIVLTCSVFLTCLFWIPVMYVSSGFIA